MGPFVYTGQWHFFKFCYFKLLNWKDNYFYVTKPYSYQCHEAFIRKQIFSIWVDSALGISMTLHWGTRVPPQALPPVSLACTFAPSLPLVCLFPHQHRCKTLPENNPSKCHWARQSHSLIFSQVDFHFLQNKTFLSLKTWLKNLSGTLPLMGKGTLYHANLVSWSSNL